MGKNSNKAARAAVAAAVASNVATHPQMTEVTLGEGKKAHMGLIPAVIADGAVTAFNEGRAQYFGPGGIKELNAKLKEMQEGPTGLYARLKALSELCVKIASGDYDTAKGYYEGACKHAESLALTAYNKGKAPEDRVNVSQLYPSWSTTKGLFLRTLEKGIDTTAVQQQEITVNGKKIAAGTPLYGSRSAVINATRKEKATAGATAQTGAARNPGVKDEQIAGLLADLSELMARIHHPVVNAYAAAVLTDAIADIREEYTKQTGATVAGVVHTPAAAAAAVA
jgi:hypothetical protein